MCTDGRLSTPYEFYEWAASHPKEVKFEQRDLLIYAFNRAESMWCRDPYYYRKAIISQGSSEGIQDIAADNLDPRPSHYLEAQINVG